MITQDDVRRVALALPETTEQPSYGMPGFRVRDRLFARIQEEGDALVIWCSDVAEKEALVFAEPATFFTTPHYDRSPIVLVRFDAIDVEELTELLTASWQLRAPARLVAELDARTERASLERLRGLCVALPEVTERRSHGEPTWFVRGKKAFVTYAERHHDDRLAFWCAAPQGEQDRLVATNPERFFRPPYVGGRGWVGVRLDVPVDWDHVAELVEEAYRLVAPRRLVAALDENSIVTGVKTASQGL